MTANILKYQITIIIFFILALFNPFQSRVIAQNKFVSKSEYKINLAKQVKMTPETIAELRKYNVSESKELKLKYFFYTNTLGKAKSLATELKKLNYEVKFGKDPDDAKQFFITGWSAKMKMSNEIVINWTKKMCETGYKFDCDFDGWETNPDQ